MSAEPKIKDFQAALEAIAGGADPKDFYRIIEEVKSGLRGKTRVKGPVRIRNNCKLSGILLETSEGGMMTGGEIKTTPATDVELRCKWVDVSKVDEDPHNMITAGMQLFLLEISSILGGK